MNEVPVAGDAPDLSAGTEILRELLAIERERLVVAREIERERRIVFPETSVIVRDIERLLKEIEGRSAGVPASTTNDQLDAFLDSIPDG
jgi:hypothetical protein